MTIIKRDHEHFMKEALKLAVKAKEQGEVPVGALVVANNQIIAKAFNQTEVLRDSTAHAEMLAITAAFNHLGAKYIKDCTLYVTLEPCVMCGGAIYWSQLGTLVYGASDQQKGYSNLGKKVLHPRTKVVSGILAEDCKTIVDDFFREIRN